MPDTDGPVRQIYRQSGQVRVDYLLAILPLAIIIALAFSAGFVALRYWAYWPIALPPIFAGGVLGYLAGRLLHWAHCRSMCIAFCIGGTLGAIMYLGHFHGLFMLQFGPEVWTRVDCLPGMIQHDVNQWSVIGKYGASGALSNWTYFWIELSLAAIVTGILASLPTDDVYCEYCGKWLDEKVEFRLEPNAAMTVIEHLLEGKIETLPELQAAPLEQQDFATVYWKECRHERTPGDPPLFYLSAHETRRVEKDVRHHYLLSQLLVTIDEIQAIAAKCPRLQLRMHGNAWQH